MVPLLEPEALTTLLMLKNDISSAVPNAPGRMPVVAPEAEAATTFVVKPVLVRSMSVGRDDWWNTERDDGRSRDRPVERNVRRTAKYARMTMIVIRNRGDQIRNVAAAST